VSAITAGGVCLDFKRLRGSVCHHGGQRRRGGGREGAWEVVVNCNTLREHGAEANGQAAEFGTVSRFGRR
jgi:hypothetical protein